MKEAAGEANMTVITIVLIAIVLTVGGIVVNRMMTSTGNSSCCQSMGGKLVGNSCQIEGGSPITVTSDFQNTYCPQTETD